MRLKACDTKIDARHPRRGVTMRQQTRLDACAATKIQNMFGHNIQKRQAVNKLLT